MKTQMEEMEALSEKKYKNCAKYTDNTFQ
jgi:hypothetical protein